MNKIKIRTDNGNDYLPWVYRAYNAIPEYLHINEPKEDFGQYYKCKFVQEEEPYGPEYIEFNTESDAVMFTLRWIDSGHKA